MTAAYMYMLSDIEWYKIIMYATYYCPATNHYPWKNGVVVSCTRCNNAPLDRSYGLENIDLCITCVNHIKNKFNPAPEASEAPPPYTP